MCTSIYFTVACHVVCEDPEEPRGQQEQRAEVEPAVDEALIVFKLSDSSYGEDGNIVLEDVRITPSTYEALYLLIGLIDRRVGYFPLDTLFWVDSQTFAVSEGKLEVADADKELLATVREFFFEDPEFLANLAWPREIGRLPLHEREDHESSS